METREQEQNRIFREHCYKESLRDAVAISVENNNLERLKHLVTAGADVNIRHSPAGWGRGRTNLAIACERGHFEMVKYLIEHGADVNARSKFGTPLYWACHGGNMEIVECLLAHKVPVNMKGGLLLPLSAACANGNVPIVRLLVEHGADVNARDKAGHTPLDAAYEAGQDEVVRFFIEYELISGKLSGFGEFALETATKLPESSPNREKIIDLFREFHPDLVMEQFCTQGPHP